MRRPRSAVCASLLLGLWLLPGRSAADAEVTDATAFEVIVLRGASVARVSGGPDGSLREEILREDPRPARREPPMPPAPDVAPEIVVVVEAGGYAPGYALATPLWWGLGLPPHHGIRRAIYRPGPPPPRFYRGWTRQPPGHTGGRAPR